MAWTSGSTLGVLAYRAVSGTSLTLTTTAEAAAGEYVVVALATANGATTDNQDNNQYVSTTDSAGGNTWTKLKEWTKTDGASQDGAEIFLVGSKLTNTIASGGTITVNYTATIIARVISAWRFTIGASSVVSIAGSNAITATDSHQAISISSLANAEYLFFRASSIEQNASNLTATSGWTLISSGNTTGGSAVTNQGLNGEFIITTATSATSDPTAGATGDTATAMVALSEASAAPPDWKWSKAPSNTLLRM